MFKQIEKLCKQEGLVTQPVGAMINGVWVTRPDIVSVRKCGFHLLTIPKTIYDHPCDKYTTLEGQKHPMFYDIEYKIKNWSYIIKRTDWLKDREKQEREMLRIEKTL